MWLHVIGSHEREPSVDAILRKVIGESTQEKTANHAPKAGAIRISLAVVEAPSRHVVGGIVRSKESVPAGECYGITQDSPADGVS